MYEYQEYPRMLYRSGSRFKHNGREYDYKIVADEDEEAAAMKQGWRISLDPLDHDGDGKAGGQRRRRKLTLPEA